MPNPPLSTADVAARCRDAGVQLVDHYRGSLQPITLRCLTCRHRWRSQAASVLRGHGCPRCAREADKLRVDEVRADLRRRGIELLSTYLHCEERIEVRCVKCRRRWRPKAISVLHRTGCPSCAGSERVTTKEAQRRCRAVGAELLGKYVNNKSRIHVRCTRCGRQWNPRACYVFRGHGCRCRDGHGKSEEQVRTIIERVTGWKFPPAKPDWLRGRSLTNGMDLDGYNPRHQVAFEYQGVQHYHATSFFGGAVKLQRTQRNDERKRQLCRRHGVLLIRIPYWKRDVEAFVRAKLER
jgi:hypothetical protein